MTRLAGLGVFFLATFLLVGCESSKKEDSGSSEFKYEEISNGTLQGEQRTPDVKIADSKKELKFPIKIGDLEVTRISNSVEYGSGSVRPITWKAYFKNPTDEQIQYEVSLCDSANAVVKAGNRYYLVDCSAVTNRMGPDGYNTEGVEFAKTYAWKVDTESKSMKFCLKGMGCTTQFVKY